MKNILIVTSSYYPVQGGLQSHIRNLVSELTKEGYNVQIASGTDYFPKGFNSNTYKIEGIQVHSFPTVSCLGMVFLKNPFDLIKIFNLASRVDIIHQHDIKFLTYFLLAFNKLLRKKIYLSSHGFIFHTNRNIKLKKAYMRMFKSFSKFYNRIICVSENDLEIAQKFSLKQCLLIDQAVKLDKFLSVKKDPQKGFFLYYGRIAPNKGLDNLIRNLAHLSQKNFHLHIAGSGAPIYIESLKDLINERDLANQISFHGEVEDGFLLSSISKAEVIFLPSLYEGFGLTLLESLATSTKVLANTNFSYSSILHRLGLQALLFDYSQFDAFEQKMREILNTDYQLNQNLSIYSYENMVKKTIQAYHE